MRCPRSKLANRLLFGCVLAFGTACDRCDRKVNKLENPFSPLIMVSGQTSVSKNRSLGVGEQKTSVIVLFEN